MVVRSRIFVRLSFEFLAGILHGWYDILPIASQPEMQCLFVSFVILKLISKSKGSHSNPSIINSPPVFQLMSLAAKDNHALELSSTKAISYNVAL